MILSFFLALFPMYDTDLLETLNGCGCKKTNTTRKIALENVGNSTYKKKSRCFQRFGAIALRTLRYIGSYVMPAVRSAEEHRRTGSPYCKFALCCNTTGTSKLETFHFLQSVMTKWQTYEHVIWKIHCHNFRSPSNPCKQREKKNQ